MQIFSGKIDNENGERRENDTRMFGIDFFCLF